MFNRALLFAFGVILLALIAVPRGDFAGAGTGNPTGNETGTGAGAENATSVYTTTAPAPSRGWADREFTLERQGDGHFYASAYVDGRSVRMLVDTGASVIALTRGDAEAIGLYWDDASVRPIGQGASGTVYGVPTRLREVEVGGMIHRDIDAVIIPEGLGISLLGQSFLGQLDTVEISGDEMVISGD